MFFLNAKICIVLKWQVIELGEKAGKSQC